MVQNQISVKPASDGNIYMYLYVRYYCIVLCHQTLETNLSQLRENEL